MRAFLEHWKPVVGYEGLYEVSDFGDVRRIAGKGCRETRILKTRKNRYGYLYLNLCKNNKAKTHMVHRLVSQAFIPNPDNLPEINHKDEDKTNNVVSNLEWCTAKQNCNHGTRIERIAEAQSKKVLQLTLDGKLVKEWSSTKECGRNGFNNGHVSECCNGKHKTHKGYRFVYAEDYYKEAVA